MSYKNPDKLKKKKNLVNKVNIQPTTEIEKVSVKVKKPKK
jgi:hypothetical protein